ncbi:endoplasmic reticulum junction formation protein lunapark-B isoform X2 [Topomyia yanbarensis]|uniref:endoplasmic reticulum junction formation protein lunapark-B isoform X2 n=1 Tax=Topomyia yanbarensis TaxID=2498891 RepID=UPI00273C2B5D|nr:endoplasmic reticulum junction formation protein lunapark-B isoform X2 [Topomyia yanbarensis]
MGAIISRFRKEKTTYEKLENLEEKIRDIEAYTISTQARQKRFVGNFLVISIGLYVLSFLVYYFAFFPPTWNERIVHSLPLLICPMIITLVKKSLAWYFERKVIINTNELKELRAEKKKILEKVMDKETYKVAVDILNRFGEKSHKAQTQSLSSLSPPKGAQFLSVTPKGVPQLRPAMAPQSSPGPQMTPIGARPMPATPIGFNVNVRQPTPMAYQQQSASFIHRPVGIGGPQTMPYRRTPFPIINHSEKGVIEKMVDYLVGDGPNSRFAMICRECTMHNGMALQEEYEYTAFRCAFCGAINPAKKQRPVAPRLPFEQAQLDKLAELRRSSQSVSESEASSPEDSHSAEPVAADQDDTPETEAPVEEGVFEESDDSDPEIETLIAPPEEPEACAGEPEVDNQEILVSKETISTAAEMRTD